MKSKLLGAVALLALGLLSIAPAANAGTFGSVSGNSMVSASGGTGGFYMGPGGPGGYVYPGAGRAMAGDTAYGNANVRMKRDNVVTDTSAGTGGFGESSRTGFASFMGSAGGNANASFNRGWGGWGGWGG